MKQEVTITITYSEIIAKVKKQLSVVGKRLANGDGASMFSKVTLSSAEEPVLTGYIKSAIQKVLAETGELATETSSSDNGVTLNLTNTRWKVDEAKSPFPDVFREDVIGYVVSFTIAGILAPNFGQLAQKFMDDYNLHMASIVKLLYYKEPPDVSKENYSIIKGEIINE